MEKAMRELTISDVKELTENKKSKSTPCICNVN